MNTDKFLIRAEAIDSIMFDGEIMVGYLIKEKERVSLIYNDLKKSVHINPETIQRCTGYRDKNNELIFEGDIIRFTEKHVGFKVVVSTNGWTHIRDLTPGTLLDGSYDLLNINFDDAEIVKPKKNKIIKLDKPEYVNLKLNDIVKKYRNEFDVIHNLQEEMIRKITKKYDDFLLEKVYQLTGTKDIETITQLVKTGALRFYSEYEPPFRDILKIFYQINDEEDAVIVLVGEMEFKINRETNETKFTKNIKENYEVVKRS